MEDIYDLIRANPGYFAWIFGLLNVLWGAFLFFNKQTHDRKLVELKHSLDLKFEEGKALASGLLKLETLAGEVAEWSGTYQLKLDTPELNAKFDQLIKYAGHFRRYPEVTQSARDLHDRCSKLLYARSQQESQLEQDMRVEVEQFHKKLIDEINKVIEAGAA